MSMAVASSMSSSPASRRADTIRRGAPARPRWPPVGTSESTPASEDGQGLGVVTGRGMSLPVVDQSRWVIDTARPLRLGQFVGELLAAGPVAASAGRVRRAGDVALD